MEKIRIVEAGNELGLGGTEYVIQLYSKYLNKEYFDVTVVGLHKGGARVKLIQDLGVRVIILNGDMGNLADILQNTDVFHWHGNGRIDKLLFSVIKANRPKMVIQTNIFGKYDYSPFYSLIDYDLYVSSMVLIRRIYQDSVSKEYVPSDLFTSKRRVLSNPVDVDHIISLMPSKEEVENFKALKNLKDCFIIGRIGRADNCKFDLIALDGFAAFAKKANNVRFLIVGITPEILTHASALGIAELLVVLEPTIDLNQLLIYYKAIDVFLAASNIGESFGMVIAEAMTAEVPVITISTEDRDNAQVELVDNNKTGLVLQRDKYKIAAAILYLYNDEDARMRLSAHSRNKVIKEYKADKVVRSLESLIFNHLQIPLSYNQDSLIKEFSLSMLKKYDERCNDLWNNSSEF